jgi:phage head maturation protease
MTVSPTPVHYHESGHGVGGETLGLRVRAITGVPKGDTGGSVRFEPYEESQVAERAAMLASGHAAVRFFCPDAEPAGHERDFERLEDLAKRHAKSHPNLWDESHATAYELVRRPRVEHAIRWLAFALAERAERDLGLSSLQVGKVIADAHDDYDASQRVFGQRARRANPADATPSEAPVRRSQNAADLAEELSARRERLAELGAVRPSKAPKKTAPRPRKSAPKRLSTTRGSRGVLPQDNLFRAVYTLPSAPGDAPIPAVTQFATGTGRTLDLQWYVANQWAEINSAYEGNFMEMIAPGAAAKTIAENQSNMRILLQHGKDPQLGDKPIAAIDEVGENGIGGYARGELFSGLDPLVVDGLRAGQYGASFRFGVTRDELVQNPTPSAYNPKGLPERTIREMAVQEFGPVTWGAYPAASAGVRSITDEILPRRALMALTAGR